MNTIAIDDITGLVLAGGRGSRMGGVDKGLQQFQGASLVARALHRLEHQTGRLMINANRSLDLYRAMGVPVCQDEMADFAGPLAGMLAGLTHCQTPYLLTVPCDSPFFPGDLGATLSAGLLEADADVATAYTREGEELFPQPVFCLMKASLEDALREFIRRGERKTGLWAREMKGARVLFADAAAFANVNTLQELADAQERPPI